MQITTKLFSILLVGLLGISGQSKAMEAQRVVFSPRPKAVHFEESASPASVKSHRRSQTAGAALESARPAVISEEPAQVAEPSALEYLFDPKKLVKDTASKAAETMVFGRPGGIISVAEAAPFVGAWYFAEPLAKAFNGLSSGISYLWNMSSEPVVTRSAHLLEDAAEEVVAEPVKRTMRTVSPSAIKTLAVFTGAGLALHNYSKSEKGQAIIEAVRRSGFETRQAVAAEGQQRRLELQQAEARLHESIATRASSAELGAAEERIGQRMHQSGMALQSAFDTALTRTKTELELAAEKRHQETQARIQALKEAQERDQKAAAERHAEVTASIAGVRSDVTSGFAAVAQRDAQRSEADKARDQRLEAMHGILTRLDERSQQRMDLFALLGAHMRKGAGKESPALAMARTDAA